LVIIFWLQLDETFNLFNIFTPNSCAYIGLIIQDYATVITV